MPSYNRTTAVDPNPGGDSVKQACIDLDADLTGAFAAANDLDSKASTHAALTTAHGATGVVGLTDVQTLTNKTLTAPKINEDVVITATATELNYCDGVTSGIQAQLNGKEPLITAGASTQYFKGDKSLGTFATDVLSAASGKQDVLVAATNIKTINGVSPLGGGDMTIAVSGKNVIINGNFSVNQRGYVSGAAVGAGLYAHDRWKMAASADAYTFSTTANVTTITIPSGKVLRQIVEGLNLQSATYVLSWEGTAQGKIGAGAYGTSGTSQAIIGGVDTIIEFGPGTISRVQLELGTVATPFENCPYSVELALCQKYCELVTTAVLPSQPFALSGTQSVACIPFKVTKAVVPTMVTITMPSMYANGALRSISSIQPYHSTTSALGLSVVCATGTYTESLVLFDGTFLVVAEL